VSQRRKVVITGIGPVTPVGTGVDEFWQGLSSGRNGVKTIKGFVFTAIYDVKSSGSDKNLKMYIPNPENFTGDQVTDYMGGDNGAVEGNSSGFNYNISFSTSDGGGITGIPLE